MHWQDRYVVSCLLSESVMPFLLILFERYIKRGINIMIWTMIVRRSSSSNTKDPDLSVRDASSIISRRPRAAQTCFARPQVNIKCKMSCGPIWTLHRSIFTVLSMEFFCWNQKRCVDSVQQLMSKYEIIGQLHLQLTEIKGAPNLHY